MNDKTFIPHITIGNFTSREKLNKAFNDNRCIKERFHSTVDKVSVEIIDDNEDYIIEMEIDLYEY
ncbi:MULTISPECIES: hypothetical protein [Clostridium]|uniref:2'-5' RNA ligase n=1 Tax=Clostridium cibarium TaxID=2762247 RepID=A0ABR8PYF0_9CLOT|nr:MULTISPECIES: hypothetical protein [Clostridium]MBD7913188.1 hypothetical protein [Clostridium cibarium]